MKRLVLIVLIVIICVGGFAVASIISYIGTLEQRNAILKETKIEVELNDITANTMSNRTIYSVGYKYYDDNNTFYLGYLDKGFATIEEARSYIGKKIEIYIDGKGNSIPVGQEPQITFALIFAIIMPTIFGLLIIALIICYYKYRKWCKKMEPIWVEKRKQSELNNKILK